MRLRVICVVDSGNIERHLQDINTEMNVTLQIAYADKILLNKIDMVDKETVDDIKHTLIYNYHG